MTSEYFQADRPTHSEVEWSWTRRSKRERGDFKKVRLAALGELLRQRGPNGSEFHILIGRLSTRDNRDEGEKTREIDFLISSNTVIFPTVVSPSLLPALRLREDKTIDEKKRSGELRKNETSRVKLLIFSLVRINFNLWDFYWQKFNEVLNRISGRVCSSRYSCRQTMNSAFLSRFSREDGNDMTEN